MNKIFKYVFLTYLFLFIPLNNAYAECSREEYNLYEKHKDEFKVEYEYNQNTDKYDLIFKNPLSDHFIMWVGDVSEELCDVSNLNEIKCPGYSVGEYYVYIFGKAANCKTVVSSYLMKLSFNKYYTDPVCADASEFILCSPSYDKEISYEDFIYRVNLYKETRKTEEENIVGDDDAEPIGFGEAIENTFYDIVSFVKANIFLVITSIVAVILLIVIVTSVVRKQRKRWRLE